MNLHRYLQTRLGNAVALLALIVLVVAGTRIAQRFGVIGKLHRPTYVVAPAGTLNARDLMLLRPLHPHVVASQNALPPRLSGANVVFPACPGGASALVADGNAVIAYGCTGDEWSAVTGVPAFSSFGQGALPRVAWQGMGLKGDTIIYHNIASLDLLDGPGLAHPQTYVVGPLPPDDQAAIAGLSARVVPTFGAVPPDLADATVVYDFCPHGGALSALGRLFAQGDLVVTKGCGPIALISSTGDLLAQPGKPSTLPWQGLVETGTGWSTPAWADLDAALQDASLQRPLYLLSQPGDLTANDLAILQRAGAKPSPDVSALPSALSGATVLFSYCPYTADAVSAVTALYTNGNAVVTYGCQRFEFTQIAQAMTSTVWRGVMKNRHNGWAGAMWPTLPGVVSGLQHYALSGG